MFYLSGMLKSSYTLEYIDSESEEFKTVIGAAGIPYDPNAITPIMLEKIVNPGIEARFKAHEEMVKAKRTMGAEATLYPMYHGTTERGLKNILANGFDVKFNKTAAYGIGTYSATNYMDAMRYARLDTTGYQFLLVCKVVKGVSKYGKPNEILDKSKYDSFTNDATYISCPYNDGIIPVYVIRYYNKIPVNLYRLPEMSDMSYMSYIEKPEKTSKMIYKFR